MLLPDEPRYEKQLGSGLIMRSVSTADEVDRIAELNAVIHEPTAGEMSRKIFNRHPNTTGRDLVYIENEQGEVAATICLIPWSLRFGEVQLPAAELGIVGTMERYRGQGLNRILMEYFWQRFQERGALLSIIQGIPYFYRQHGYEYAMLPLEGGWRIQPDQLPKLPVKDYCARQARVDDITLMARLYEEWTGSVDIKSDRTEAVWQYLLERTPNPESMQHNTMILESPEGEPAAYFRIADFHFFENLLTVDELSRVDFSTALAVMNYLKQKVKERGKDGIRLNLPQNHEFIQLAQSLGAVDLGAYSWQVSIPNRSAFLRKLAPLLEKRLSGSMFAGWTGTFGLNLYKEVIGLTFNEGRLEDVRPVKNVDHIILNVPPVQFIPLVLGGRSIDEIHAAFPDAYAHGPWKLLVNTLFPKTSAFLAANY